MISALYCRLWLAKYNKWDMWQKVEISWGRPCGAWEILSVEKRGTKWFSLWQILRTYRRLWIVFLLLSDIQDDLLTVKSVACSTSVNVRDDYHTFQQRRVSRLEFRENQHGGAVRGLWLISNMFFAVSCHWEHKKVINLPKQLDEVHSHSSAGFKVTPINQEEQKKTWRSSGLRSLELTADWRKSQDTLNPNFYSSPLKQAQTAAAVENHDELCWRSSDKTKIMEVPDKNNILLRVTLYWNLKLYHVLLWQEHCWVV